MIDYYLNHMCAQSRSISSEITPDENFPCADNNSVLRDTPSASQFVVSGVFWQIMWSLRLPTASEWLQVYLSPLKFFSFPPRKFINCFHSKRMRQTGSCYYETKVGFLCKTSSLVKYCRKAELKESYIIQDKWCILMGPNLARVYTWVIAVCNYC